MKGKKRILVVSEDYSFRRFFCFFLREKGFIVETSGSVRRAATRIKDSRLNLDFLIVDDKCRNERFIQMTPLKLVEGASLDRSVPAVLIGNDFQPPKGLDEKTYASKRPEFNPLSIIEQIATQLNYATA